MAVVFDNDLISLTSEMQSIRAQRAALKKREDEIRATVVGVLEQSGQDSAMTASGRPLLHLNTYSRASVNSKKLAALYPDVYEDCLVEVEVTTVQIADVE